MSQRHDVLRMLRAAGPVGVHTFDLRKNFIGNPSQRIAELEAEGHVIRHTRERLRGSAVGTRYVLVEDVASRATQPPVGGPETGSVAEGGPSALALDVTSTKPRPQCAIFDDWDEAA